MVYEKGFAPMIETTDTDRAAWKIIITFSFWTFRPF